MLRTQNSKEKAKIALEALEKANDELRKATDLASAELSNLRTIQNICLVNDGHNWSKLEKDGSPEEGAKCLDCGFVFGP